MDNLEEDSSSPLEQEIEALSAIFIDELTLERSEDGKVKEVSLLLHPATGNDTTKQFVCMNLIFHPTSNYPDEMPAISIRNPRGLGEEEVASLVKDMKIKAIENLGEVMLFTLIQMAKDSLTEGNIPHSPCSVCLEQFTESSHFHRTACYHYFHHRCLHKYLEHEKAQLEEEEAEAVSRNLHLNTNNKTKVIICPMCRCPLDEESLTVHCDDSDEEQEVVFTISATMKNQMREMAERFEQQKAKGGIIDLEWEKNKFLINSDESSPKSTAVVNESEEGTLASTENSNKSQMAPKDPGASNTTSKPDKTTSRGHIRSPRLLQDHQRNMHGGKGKDDHSYVQGQQDNPRDRFFDHGNPNRRNGGRQRFHRDRNKHIHGDGYDGGNGDVGQRHRPERYHTSSKANAQLKSRGGSTNRRAEGRMQGSSQKDQGGRRREALTNEKMHGRRDDSTETKKRSRNVENHGVSCEPLDADVKESRYHGEFNCTRNGVGDSSLLGSNRNSTSNSRHGGLIDHRHEGYNDNGQDCQPRGYGKTYFQQGRGRKNPPFSNEGNEYGWHDEPHEDEDSRRNTSDRQWYQQTRGLRHKEHHHYQSHQEHYLPHQRKPGRQKEFYEDEMMHRKLKVIDNNDDENEGCDKDGKEHEYSVNSNDHSSSATCIPHDDEMNGPLEHYYLGYAQEEESWEDEIDHYASERGKFKGKELQKYMRYEKSQRCNYEKKLDDRIKMEKAVDDEMRRIKREQDERQTASSLRDGRAQSSDNSYPNNGGPSILDQFKQQHQHHRPGYHSAEKGSLENVHEFAIDKKSASLEREFSMPSASSRKVNFPDNPQDDTTPTDCDNSFSQGSSVKEVPSNDTDVSKIKWVGSKVRDDIGDKSTASELLHVSDNLIDGEAYQYAWERRSVLNRESAYCSRKNNPKNAAEPKSIRKSQVKSNFESRKDSPAELKSKRAKEIPSGDREKERVGTKKFFSKDMGNGNSMNIDCRVQYNEERPVSSLQKEFSRPKPLDLRKGNLSAKSVKSDNSDLEEKIYDKQKQSTSIKFESSNCSGERHVKHMQPRLRQSVDSDLEEKIYGKEKVMSTKLDCSNDLEEKRYDRDRQPSKMLKKGKPVDFRKESKNKSSKKTTAQPPS